MIEIKFSGKINEVINEIVSFGKRLSVDPDKYDAMESALSPAIETALDAVENIGPREVDPIEKPKRTRRPREDKPKGIRTKTAILKAAAHDELEQKLKEAAEKEAAGIPAPEVPALTVTETGRTLEVADKENPDVTDCRAVLNLLCTAKGTGACERILSDFGAVRVSEVPNDKRAEFVKRCIADINS